MKNINKTKEANCYLLCGIYLSCLLPPQFDKVTEEFFHSLREGIHQTTCQSSCNLE